MKNNWIELLFNFYLFKIVTIWRYVTGILQIERYLSDNFEFSIWSYCSLKIQKNEKKINCAF